MFAGKAYKLDDGLRAKQLMSVRWGPPWTQIGQELAGKFQQNDRATQSHS